MSIVDRLLGRQAFAATTRLDAAAVRQLGEVGQEIAALAHPDPSLRDRAEAALRRRGLSAVDPLVSVLAGAIGPLDEDARRRVARVLRSTLTSEHRRVSDTNAARLVEALTPLSRQASVRPDLLPVLARLGAQLVDIASSQRHYGGPSDRQMRQAAAALRPLGEAEITELFGDRARWVRLILELRALEATRTEAGFDSVLRRLQIAREPSLSLVGHYYGDEGEVERAEGPSERGLHGMTRGEVARDLARGYRGGSVTIDPVEERQVAHFSESAGTYSVSASSMRWTGTMPACLRIGGTLVWRSADDEYLVWDLPEPRRGRGR